MTSLLLTCPKYYYPTQARTQVSGIRPCMMNTSSSSIQPSIVLDRIHIGVVIAVSTLVFLIFATVYVQLVLVLWYGYKLVSYQTLFLFNISVWSSIRLTLYSFYFFHCCQLVTRLPPIANWFLVSFPSILVYMSLALIVYYFMEVSNVYYYCGFVCLST